MRAQGDGALRIGIRDHGPGAHHLAAFEAHTFPGQHRRHGHSRRQDRTRLARRVGQRERDLAHAAVDVAPCPGPAFEAARGVHQMDPGRPAVAGAGVGADDALAVQGGPQALVADVVLHHVGDGRLEDDVDRLTVARQEVLELTPVGRVAHPRVAPAVAQSSSDPVEQLLVGAVALDVAGGELCHGRRAAGRIVPQRDRGAVLERAPQVGVDELYAVAAVVAARARPRPTGAAGRPSRHTGSRASPGRGTAARGCTRHRAGRAVRGRARCVRHGRDTPPRSTRCARLPPRRRPIGGPRAPRPGPGDRSVRARPS